MDSEEKMEKCQRFIEDGKDAARKGDMCKALEFFKLAHNIHPSQKLESRIKKIEEIIAQNNSDDDDEDEEFVNVENSGLNLFKDLHDKLYDYQRTGVAFMYSLYRDGRKGGILADDMGLGKTIQVISFLSGMYDNELVNHTLLVMPTSLITNWTKEFSKWTPGMRVKEFHGDNRERTRNLEKVQRRGGVILTTYTMLISNWQQLSSYHGREFKWDYMILDEAHKIKNTSTKTAKSAYAIPSKNRILLTGTPVQNNLKEMWALFDFACHGTLLGTAKTFKTEYENPITRARERDSTPGEKALGARMSETLMSIIEPYFLRRTKAEVQKNKEKYSNKSNQEVNPQKDSGAVMPKLMRKNDLIIWTYLSAVQEDIYRQFISLDHIKELLTTTRSPLAELTILKKLCDHPRLLSARAIANLGLEENTTESQQDDDMVADTHSIANVPDDTLISESGKLVFLFALLERLRQEGHRTLVFAHYRKVLDIIERILGNRGFKVMRLDGTITQIAERERRITLFQNDERYSVFLLTTQVGGVGITLTAADRVVIYDPSWNPATDAQAVDRAYRIGQTENVVIYRLITCGTVEEKIYRRQVFKDSLIRQNTGDKKNPFRYFSKQELKELFTLEDTRSSSTQLQLQALHSRHRQTDAELDEHIAHLHAMEMFGISDHDLMFSLDPNCVEAVEDQEEHKYIEGRVQKAQELTKAESELQMQLAESMASSTEPAWLRQPADNNRERSHEKKPRNPRPSPAFPQHDPNFNGSPVVVDLEQSGSIKEDDQQNLSKRMIDLTVDESMTEEQTVGAASKEILDTSNVQSISDQRSYLEAADISPQEVMEESLVVLEAADAAAGDVTDASVQELMEESAMSEASNAAAAGEGSLADVTTATEDLNRTSDLKYDDSKMDLGLPHFSPQKNKRLSDLQASNSSFKSNTSSRVSTGLESFTGNFNLQLENSDMSSDHDNMEPQETEAEERNLLSQLRMEGSFDVDKSLLERPHKEALTQSLNISCSPEMDVSNDSIVVTRKKKRAVISESEEEDDDYESQLENSFQKLGASTSKSAPSASTPLRSRKSVGGNTSVASRRSLHQSIIDDMDNLSEDKIDAEDDEEEEDISERHSEEAEEEDLVDQTSEMEEPSGETLNSEEEEEEDEDFIDHQTGDKLELEESTGDSINSEEEEYSKSADPVESRNQVSKSLDDSTNESELASSERLNQCTVDAGLKTNATSSEDSYNLLATKGKECYNEGKLDEALGFFLKAIDIRPGDPEIQLLTIKLYRQLSLIK